MKLNLKSIICSLALTLAAGSVFAANATVVSVTGKVEVSRNNAWVPVSANSSIAEGEVISTGFNSEALIRYNDSVMRVGPLTRITLEKLATSEKKDDVSVYVSTGAVRSTVKHTENKRVTYTVRNPVAVASVRGTDFTFLGTGKAICYKGAIALMRGSDFNAKARGIRHPADGLPAATDEDVQNAEDALPGDDMTAEDVNPYEKGGTLITAGQSSEIDEKTGNPSTPKTFAEENHETLTKQDESHAVLESEGAGEIPGRKTNSQKTSLKIKVTVED